MADKNMLSEQEVSLLMAGTETLGGNTSVGKVSILSSSERSQLNIILNEMCQKMGDPLTGLSGRAVKISGPVIKEENIDGFRAQYGRDWVQVMIPFSSDISGAHGIYFKVDDALTLGGIGMGEDLTEPPTELEAAHQSSICENVNQMVSSGLTAVRSKYSKNITLEPPRLTIVNSADDLEEYAGGVMVTVHYDFSIEGLVSSKLVQVFEREVALQLATLSVASAAMSFDIGDTKNVLDSFDDVTADMVDTSSLGGSGLQTPEFSQLTDSGPDSHEGNIGLLMDVPMEMTVELGRTRMMVKKILDLGEGSIIELDKLAGEPVDLLVNGILIAKGEVVVIDEHFGVRVTDIISQADRMKGMEKM